MTRINDNVTTWTLKTTIIGNNNKKISNGYEQLQQQQSLKRHDKDKTGLTHTQRDKRPETESKRK